LHAQHWIEPLDATMTPYAQTVRQFRNGQIAAIHAWLSSLVLEK